MSSNTDDFFTDSPAQKKILVVWGIQSEDAVYGPQLFAKVFGYLD